MPRWDGKFWAGDHEYQRVVRNQENPPAFIETNDPRFSKGVWLTYQDLSCLYQQLVLNCEKWKEQNPECKPISDDLIVGYLNALQ
jgi:hypothetical protein